MVFSILEKKGERHAKTHTFDPRQVHESGNISMVILQCIQVSFQNIFNMYTPRYEINRNVNDKKRVEI